MPAPEVVETDSTPGGETDGALPDWIVAIESLKTLSHFELDKTSVEVYDFQLQKDPKKVLEMVRVRRSIWIAALVCGALLVSLVAFLGHQTREDETAWGRHTGGAEQLGEEVFRKGKSPSNMADKTAAPSKPTTKTRVSIDATGSLGLAREPRLGEVARVDFAVTPSDDVPNMQVEFRLIEGLELVSSDRIFSSSAKKDETKEFSIRVRFVSSPVLLTAKATGTAITAEGRKYPLRFGGRLDRVIVDEETGQYGAWEELFQDPSWNFDPLSGENCRVSPAVAERNRKWIENMKELEGSITDWEGLYLCRDAMLYSPQSPEESLKVYERKGWQTILEKGKILLERGWLKEFRQSPRTDIRTYTLNRPDVRRKLQEHLEWLGKLRPDR